MIPVEIRSKANDVGHDITSFIERRVSFALDRFRDPRRVVVSLEDLNGPKGGPDKHCQVIAEFGFGSVVVEEVQSDWYVAIAGAMHRVAQKLARTLARSNRISQHPYRRPVSRPAHVREPSAEHP